MTDRAPYNPSLDQIGEPDGFEDDADRFEGEPEDIGGGFNLVSALAAFAALVVVFFLLGWI